MHLKTVLWERVMFKQTHTKKHAVFQANESGMEGDDEESTPSSKDSLIISPAESLSSPAHRLQGLNLLIKLLRLASPGHQVSLPGLSGSDWLLGISLSFHLSLSLSFICLKWFCNSLCLSVYHSVSFVSVSHSWKFRFAVVLLCRVCMLRSFRQ